MSLEEAILDKVRRLPPAKQEEVLRFADGLDRNAASRRVPSRSGEMKWLDENRAAYADSVGGCRGRPVDRCQTWTRLMFFPRQRPQESKPHSSFTCFLKIRFPSFRAGEDAGFARIEAESFGR